MLSSRPQAPVPAYMGRTWKYGCKVPTALKHTRDGGVERCCWGCPGLGKFEQEGVWREVSHSLEWPSGCHCMGDGFHLSKFDHLMPYQDPQMQR